MMKLSTKGRYGVRIMLTLAINKGKGYVLLRHIAKKEGISLGYLEHIVPLLKSAKLITSSRGAHGGYMLARPPAQITLKEIVQTLEGPLLPVECIERPAVCSQAQSCAARDIWGELAETVSQTLESITLENMAQRQKKKRASALSYSI